MNIGRKTMLLLALLTLFASLAVPGPRVQLVAASPPLDEGDEDVAAQAAYLLDQAQESINYGFWFDRTHVRWQEFKPARTPLAKLDLYIQKRGDPGNVGVSVKNREGKALWSTTVPGKAIGTQGWIEIPVDPPISLTPESSYYIHVSSDALSSSPETRFFWMGQETSKYARGISSEEETLPGYDYAFRTWSLTQPDLIVQSITGPAVACPGQALGKRIALTVRNVGAAEAIAAEGYFHTDLVLSADRVIGNAGDRLLIGGRDQVYQVLTPGQSYRVPLAGSNAIPADVAPGTYYLGAVADSVGNHVVESNEKNNTGFYYPLRIVSCETNLSASLHVEDALEGVPVNKLVGDLAGPTYYTRVEIVSKLFTFDTTAKDDVSVTLTVPNDLFGSPTNTWVRNASGGVKTAVSYTNPGSGQYRVTTDLRTSCWGKLCWHSKQIVWRFLIPNDTPPQDVNLVAETRVPDRIVVDPLATGKIRILEPGSARALIVTNRELLYANEADGDVNNLLARLYTEAAGAPASHSPLGVIYYVDRYDSRALNWDNSAVDYASSTTANRAADAIDDLIEDWHEDGTEFTTIVLPIIGEFRLPVAWPTFLMIVGDDDTIPFYRYDDPSNDEGINAIGGCPDGWCVDSATNPAIRATDEDYFFTDNPYADLGGGTDWQTGELELWTGRILGDSAADMLSLLEEGVSWDNGDRGGAVMASVDGWELGLEPDPGGAGHIDDLYDVPALLRAKGFQVRNDNLPGAEVATIDVMSPFEGGSNSWNTQFKNAANNAAGMDLFFIGGHNSYDHATIPGDDFTPDDTCAVGCDYDRFDDDHPIALIVGCHGGLPVPDVDVPGGVDDDMVYDLVHEGASAYIGATGFSYGSPNNLHKCTWGERLMQRFFERLTAPGGGNSMALGAALARAKRDYVFGYGGNDALDRKTVTEFNLYGVPWTFVYYPAAQAAVQPAAEPEERGYTIEIEPAVRAAQTETYTRTLSVEIDGYQARQERQGDVTYDLFSIKGGDMAISDGAPILPYVQAFSMTLPYGASVTSVLVPGTRSTNIGRFNVPIADARPWSQGGLVYTTTTEIDYFYPKDLVQVQESGQGLLVTVFPIQHNPTSDQTLFYDRFGIQIVYKAPLAVAVTEVSTDKALYRSGETVRTRSTVENVGDARMTLTAILEIEDALGNPIERKTSGAFVVPPGGSYELPINWMSSGEGSYRATVSILSGRDVIGAAATSFEVTAGEITSWRVPKLVVPRRQATFNLSFANYRDQAVNATAYVGIYDAENALVAELPPKAFSVGANAQATTQIAGILDGVPGATYSAVVRVAVGEQSYGPEATAFVMGHPLYLPLVFNQYGP